MRARPRPVRRPARRRRRRRRRPRALDELAAVELAHGAVCGGRSASSAPVVRESRDRCGRLRLERARHQLERGEGAGERSVEQLVLGASSAGRAPASLCGCGGCCAIAELEQTAARCARRLRCFRGLTAAAERVDHLVGRRQPGRGAETPCPLHGTSCRSADRAERPRGSRVRGWRIPAVRSGTLGRIAPQAFEDRA